MILKKLKHFYNWLNIKIKYKIKIVLLKVNTFSIHLSNPYFIPAIIFFIILELSFKLFLDLLLTIVFSIFFLLLIITNIDNQSFEYSIERLEPYFYHYFCGKILRSRFHNNKIYNKFYAEYLIKLKDTNKNPLDEENDFRKELKLKYKKNNFEFNTLDQIYFSYFGIKVGLRSWNRSFMLVYKILQFFFDDNKKYKTKKTFLEKIIFILKRTLNFILQYLIKAILGIPFRVLQRSYLSAKCFLPYNQFRIAIGEKVCLREVFRNIAIMHHGQISKDFPAHLYRIYKTKKRLWNFNPTSKNLIQVFPKSNGLFFTSSSLKELILYYQILMNETSEIASTNSLIRLSALPIARGHPGIILSGQDKKICQMSNITSNWRTRLLNPGTEKLVIFNKTDFFLYNYKQIEEEVLLEYNKKNHDFQDKFLEKFYKLDKMNVNEQLMWNVIENIDYNFTINLEGLDSKLLGKVEEIRRIRDEGSFMIQKEIWKNKKEGIIEHRIANLIFEQYASYEEFKSQILFQTSLVTKSIQIEENNFSAKFFKIHNIDEVITRDKRINKTIELCDPNYSNDDFHY